MTKKHFRALAKALHEVKTSLVNEGEETHTWDRLINAVADVCYSQNPRFRREQFLYACEHGL